MNSVNGVPSDFIVLNVGGTRYQTTRTTIHKHPETMLSVLLNNTSKDTAEIFIDHDGELFRWILLWYRTGVLEPCKIAGWDATLAFYGIEVGEEEDDDDVKTMVEFLVAERGRPCLTFLEKNRYLELNGIPSVALNFNHEWFVQNRDEIDCALKQRSLCIHSVSIGYCDLSHIGGFPASRIISEYGKIDHNKHVIITMRKVE